MLPIQLNVKRQWQEAAQSGFNLVRSIYLSFKKKRRLVYSSILQTCFWILLPVIQDSDSNSNSRDSQIFWSRFWFHGVWFWFHGCHNNNSLDSMVFWERNWSHIDTTIMISVNWLCFYLFFIYHLSNHSYQSKIIDQISMKNFSL